MPVRGVRGATVVELDSPEEVLSATRELLLAIQKENPGMSSKNIASIIFTVTDDLISVYPAKAARELGWTLVPLMCMREIPVPGGLHRCIRVLLHWNTRLSQASIRNVYLREAEILRPDLRID